MKEWWVKMLTLIVGILGVSAAFVTRGAEFRELQYLLWSWGLLTATLILGSLKLWGWSTKRSVPTQRPTWWRLLYWRSRNYVHTVAECPVVSFLSYVFFILGLGSLLLFGAMNSAPERTKRPIPQVTSSPSSPLGAPGETKELGGMDWPSWISAGASVVNVVVLIMYAISTRGIRRETGRQAELAGELARQAKAGFKLQVLVAYQEQIRAGSVAGVALMEKALAQAFPDDWAELQKIFVKAADDYKREQGLFLP